MAPNPQPGLSRLRRIGAALQNWQKSGRLASAGLLAVVVTLPGMAFWGALTVYHTGQMVRQSTELSNYFEQARDAVTAEESREREYRLEPGDGARELHAHAAAELVAALQQAAALGDPDDRALIADVMSRHTLYLEIIVRMFAAVDAGDTARVKQIDTEEADPVFDKVETRVFEAAIRHQSLAEHHLKLLTATQTKVLVATPIVFVIGVVLVIFFWTTMRRYQRDAEASLAREASNTRASERRFRGLVQNTSDMILICAAPGTITYQSPATETAWNYADTALLNEPVLALAHPDDKAALHNFWEQLQLVGSDSAEGTARTIDLRLRDGKADWREAELIGTNLLHDPAVQGVVVTVRDITERKTFEQQLTKQAFYDGLTGLPNRVLFRDRLEQALVRAGRLKGVVGVLFLDLDNFKLVNDSLGHQVGDELLTEAAIRLKACTRSQDTVARLGGDEFVIILESLQGPGDAETVAAAVAHQFSRPFMLGGREVIVTTSVGIAMSEAGREHAESLLRDADIAMYRAKSEGRARYVVFDPSMYQDSMARLDLENDLRHALERNELRIFYQPIVALNSGVVTEVEALVRWQHPTRGLVPPVEFIPIAEETGLIIPLGLWVLEEACRQVMVWRKEMAKDSPLVLSVNLSPRQFQQPSLVADVARALEQTGFPASCLKLEITESVIMRDAESTIRTMWELKALGLQLAIDDFGTGYSSLSYLKRLPLDVLKIDRSFINGIGSSQEDTAIVHAIMALAGSLGLKVTGEGIETTEQAALLDDWHCDRGQGYLFSRPLNSDDTKLFLEEATKQAPSAAAQPPSEDMTVNAC